MLLHSILHLQYVPSIPLPLHFLIYLLEILIYSGSSVLEGC